MSNEKLCQKFLRAAAETIRRCGFVRGTRRDFHGAVCMLGAMDNCGVYIYLEERIRIEEHLSSLLPPRPAGAVDRYNPGYGQGPGHHIAWWNNMVAQDGEEVAQKLEAAAESC